MGAGSMLPKLTVLLRRSQCGIEVRDVVIEAQKQQPPAESWHLVKGKPDRNTGRAGASMPWRSSPKPYGARQCGLSQIGADNRLQFIVSRGSEALGEDGAPHCIHEVSVIDRLVQQHKRPVPTAVTPQLVQTTPR